MLNCLRLHIDIFTLFIKISNQLKTFFLQLFIYVLRNIYTSGLFTYADPTSLAFRTKFGHFYVPTKDKLQKEVIINKHHY